MAYRSNKGMACLIRKPWILAAVALASALPSQSQNLASVRSALEAKYACTTATADKLDIVKAGDVLVLKKSGLVTVDVKSRNLYQNKYVNGQIKSPFHATSSIFKFVPGAKELVPSDRTFVSGEKVWLTGIDVRGSGIILSLLTDSYLQTRYEATLAFPFEKGSNPTAAQALALIAEVFDIQPSEDAKSAQPATFAAPATAVKAAAEVAPAPIAPPPPPPADPKTIALGQTIDQVTNTFGVPESIRKLGSKQIYVYKDMKVTFVGGKVTDVQ